MGNGRGTARNGITANVCKRRKSMKMTATNFDRITIDPEQLNGQPCVRGMRITDINGWTKKFKITC
jgi:hypothetical protein